MPVFLLFIYIYRVIIIFLCCCVILCLLTSEKKANKNMLEKKIEMATHSISLNHDAMCRRQDAVYIRELTFLVVDSPVSLLHLHILIQNIK